MVAGLLLNFSPASAQVLPSFRIFTGASVTPDAAWSYYNSTGATTSTPGLCQYPNIAASCATTGRMPRAAELNELARALKNDPNLIYEYVRNSVQTEFLFGSHKGALGAMIDSSADAFDQASLLVELLRQAGFTAHYQYGDITLTGAQFYAWSGVQGAQAACQLLSSGGIPVVVNTTPGSCSALSGNVTTITLSHVWVQAVINGATYLFDPAFKVNTVKTGINVPSAAGLVSGQPLATATSSVATGTAAGGFASVSGFDSTDLQTLLSTYAANIRATLAQPSLQGADMSDLVGGLVLEPGQRPAGGWQQTSLAYISQVRATWDYIPDQFRVQVGLTTLGATGAADGQIATTLFGDEVYGRRVEVVSIPDSATVKNGFASQWRLNLMVNFVSVQQGPDENPGGNANLQIAVNHPFAGVGDAGTAGSYGDVTTTKVIGTILPTTIVMGWGNTSSALSAKWGRESANDRYQYFLSISAPGDGSGSSASTVITSGDLIRAKIGATYLAEFSKALDIQSRLSQSLGSNLHVVGVVTTSNHINYNNYAATASQFNNGLATSKVTGSTQSLLEPIYCTPNINPPNINSGPDTDPDLYPTFPEDSTCSYQVTSGVDATVNVSVWSGFTAQDISSYPNGISVDDEVSVIDLETGAAVTSIVASPTTASQTAHRAALHSIAMVAASLEGSVAEQLTDVPDASSTVRRLAWGNTPESGETATLASRAVVSIPSASSVVAANLAYDGVLGVPPAVGSLPAPKSTYVNTMKGDTAAYINHYTASGYSVVASADTMLGPGAVLGPESYSSTLINTLNNKTQFVFTRLPSLQRGGAFIANLYGANGDPVSIAHVTTRMGGFSKGGGGPTTTAAAKYDPAEAANILKDRFADRSVAEGVDLTSGQAGYESPTLNSVGQGKFPYKLDLAIGLRGEGLLQTQERLNNPEIDPQATGFVTNHDDSVVFSSSGLRALGDGARVSAASTSLATFVALQDIFSSAPSTSRETVAALATNYWLSSLIGNTATVYHGVSTAEFVQTDGGNYRPMTGADVFVATGAPYVKRPNIFQTTGSSLTNATDDGSAFQTESTTRVRMYDQVGVALTGAHGDSRAYSYWSGVNGDSTINAPSVQGYRLSTWSFPEGVSVTYTYPAATDANFVAYVFASSIKNNLGQTLPLTRTAAGTFTDAGGGQYSVSLRGPVTGDAASRIGSIFTPDDTVNANVTYGYDTVGRVNVASDPIAVRNPSLRGPYQFFIADGYRGEHVDPAGGGYSVVTQRSGYLKLYTDEIGRVTQAALDGRGRTLSHTYPEGDQSQFSYDGNDNVLSLTQVAKPGSGLGNLVAMASYDPVWNLPTSVTDFRGYTTQITYYPAGSSGAGEMATATRPNPVSGAAGSGPVYSFSYDSSGRLLTATDPLNIVTANSYDANGYLATMTLDPSGLNLKTTFTNDATGNVLSVQSPRTDVTQVAYATYDPMRRKVFEISANSNSKDVSGNVLPLLVTKHVYDLLGREVQTLSGTGTSTNGSDFSPQKATTIVYDAASNKIQTTLWNGLVSTDATTALGVTQVAYDAVNRPICTAVRLNPSQFASLPGACALSQQGPDGADRISQTIYDLSGQPLQVLRGVGTPGQQVYASYAYGGDGEKLTETDANNNQTAYQYDGFNRLYQTQFPSPSTINAANPADYEQYGYDNNGNRLSLRKRDGVTISYTYDPLNRQTQKAVPAVGAVAGYTVNTVYDLDGRPTSMLYASTGLGIAYSYDNAGRMLTETNTMPAAAQVLTYGYDKGGNKTSIKYPDAAAFTYGYDGMDRFNWVSNAGSNAPTDVGVNFDALGRVSWVGRNHVGGTAYGYDLADRVTKVQIEAGTGELWTWSYNAGGQVKTKTSNNSAYDQTPANDNEAHTYDGLNRDAAVTAVSGYDANQNLTTDPVGARSFTYDAENKLVAASGSGTSAAVSLSYDPLGRLYQEVATSGGSSTTTQFLYSGDKLVAEYNGAGVMQMRYLHGPSEDQPLIQYGGSSVDGTTAQFLYTDRQGSVVALQNTAGTVQTPFTYGPYGEPASWGGTRFAYTGQIEIPEARVYYYKARVYDPVQGRFNQTDPIGYKDNLNLYGYVGDDPFNKSDPTGTEFLFIGGAGVQGQYLQGFRTAFENAGIQHVRVPGSAKSNIGSLAADVLSVTSINDLHFANSLVNDSAIKSEAAHSNEVRARGEQYNLGGYSYGSAAAASAAYAIAKNGGHVDNLVLVGAPINKDLYDAVTHNPNIGKVIVVDLSKHGDPIKAGMNDVQIAMTLPKLTTQMRGNEGHFYYSGTGHEADRRRTALANDLVNEGVK